MFTGSSVAIVTPMTAAGHIDFAALEHLINWQIEAGTAALVIAGTTGESATLTKSEHVAVIEAAVKCVRKRIPVIAGTGSNSTAQTVELSAAVDELGVDGYLVVTPYYNKPPQAGLYHHFIAVADAVTRPVMLYNVPGRTGVDLLPETVAKLSIHDRIFGIKEATGDLQRLAKIRDLVDNDFMLFSGDDPTARDFMLQGGHGVVSVTANVAPVQMAKMCSEAVAGDAAAAASTDAHLAKLHKDLFVESNPIPVKWALERMGLIDSGIRLPLVTLSEASKPAVESAIRYAGIELA